MPQHGTLIVEDLHMTYQAADGPVRAVQGVSFTIQAGEFYTLLGASGCGKTTILRCVAGLEAPEHGRIVVGDTVVYSSVEVRFVDQKPTLNKVWGIGPERKSSEARELENLLPVSV